MKFFQKGFTYIEIVIALSIVALVTSAGSYMYSNFQSDSRDSRRKTDLGEVQLALEAYRADHNTYPSSLTSLTNENYLETLPSDPRRYVYSYFGLSNEETLSSSCGSDCQTYRLMARLEETAPVCGNGFGNCNGSNNSCTYCLSPHGISTGTIADADGDGIADSNDEFPNDWSADPCLDTPTIIGTEGTDNIIGTTGDDVIHALGGNDSIDGNGGNDHICTLSGNDSIVGRDGNDIVNANGGNNSIDLGDGNNYLTSGSGNDHIMGGSGRDIVITLGGNLSINVGDGDNYVRTGTGNDNIESGNGADVIVASDGNNAVNSGGGDDNIDSGDGNDNIDAGDGTDTCSPDGGSDKLTSCEIEL